MFRRASTCLDVFGQLFSKVCAARNIKLLLHLLLGLPNEFSGEVESGSFCKDVTHQSRVIRTKTKITGKQALHKIHKPTAAPSTWSLPSSRSWNKILQEVSTHGNIWQPFAAQPGSNRLQPGSNPAPTLLDMTRATVVLPVPGAPEKTKCPSSGTSEPSWQPLASSVNGCQRSLCFRLITLAYLLFHNTLKSGFEVKGT